MNLKKTIKNLRREEFEKSFPNKKDLDSLPKTKVNGQEVPDMEQLEKETVGNVVLNCLTIYKCEDRREGFYIQSIADSIINAEGDEIELKDKLNKFLIEVLDSSIFRIEKIKKERNIIEEVQKGTYAGWVIVQVLEELGVKEEI